MTEQAPSDTWMIPNPHNGSKTPKWVVQEAYNRLFIWEENTAYADGRVSYDNWVQETDDDMVNNLVNKAIQTIHNWGNPQYGPPIDPRPSLLLLHDEWLSQNGYPDCHDSITPQSSQIFEESDPKDVELYWE